MKVEDKIVAINPCIMDDSGLPSLTVGREYVIININGYQFTIIDDDNDFHDFDLDKFEKYFVEH